MFTMREGRGDGTAAPYAAIVLSLTRYWILSPLSGTRLDLVNCRRRSLVNLRVGGRAHCSCPVHSVDVTLVITLVCVAPKRCSCKCTGPISPTHSGTRVVPVRPPCLFVFAERMHVPPCTLLCVCRCNNAMVFSKVSGLSAPTKSVKGSAAAPASGNWQISVSSATGACAPFQTTRTSLPVGKC